MFKDGKNCFCPRCENSSGCSEWEPHLKSYGRLAAEERSCHNCRFNESTYTHGCQQCSLSLPDDHEF